MEIAQFFRSSWLILQKDLIVELRARYVINSVIAFVGASFLMAAYSTRLQDAAPSVRNGMLWIIVIYASMSVLWRAFVTEKERKTDLVLHLVADALPIWFGKFLLNFLYSLVVCLLVAFLFIVLLSQHVESWGLAAIITILAPMGLAAVSTFLSVIIAESDNKGSLFSVLSIPILIPWILLVIRLTRFMTQDGFIEGVLGDVFALLGYCGAMLSVSFVLFEQLWNE